MQTLSNILIRNHLNGHHAVLVVLVVVVVVVVVELAGTVPGVVAAGAVVPVAGVPVVAVAGG